MKRYTFPNNDIFIVALIIFIFFLLIEVTLRIYDLYFYFPEVDIPSHFFAGMAILSGVYWVLSLVRIKKIKVFSVFYTLLVAIFWEILETLQELIIENPPHLVDIFFWDGFFDIIITVIGGAFTLIFFYILRRTTPLRI
ncbi:MAG: hypothetical protein KJ674_04715 [Nanoarchaeota archaeon]|nr:hypothetical protein [Nanoarchaeota archaeon]